jgi:hypothetical protein
MLQAGRSRVRFPNMLLAYSSQLHHGPEVDSASLWGKGRLVRNGDNLTAICELSRKCGSLDVSQLYVPPRPVTGIPLSLPYMATHVSYFTDLII